MLREINEKIEELKLQNVPIGRILTLQDCKAMIESVIKQIESITPDGSLANFDDGFRSCRDSVLKLLKGETE
jgi:hypothetical protein